MAAGTVLQSFCTHCQGPVPDNVRMFCTGCMALGKPVLAILHGGGLCGVGADKKPHVAGSHEIWCYDCAVSPGFPQRGQPVAHGEQQVDFLEQGGEMNAHDHAPAALIWTSRDLIDATEHGCLSSEKSQPKPCAAFVALLCAWILVDFIFKARKGLLIVCYLCQRAAIRYYACNMAVIPLT